MAGKTGFSILNTLNQQSLQGAEHATSEFVIEMIPLEEIEPNADNFYNTEDIETLAEDIKQNGLMHNVVVGKRGDSGRYTLVSGERRYRAFTLLNAQGAEGYAAIPAVVDSEQNPLLVKLKLISANATARVLSDYEKTEQAAQIEDIAKKLKQQGAELPGRVREIVADTLGVSPAQAGRLTKINHDLVPEVKQQFAAGAIGVTEAYEVATLPPEQQVQAVETRAAKPSEPKTKSTEEENTTAKTDALSQEVKRERARNMVERF
jgi:ParB family chromosome partitioning protein